MNMLMYITLHLACKLQKCLRGDIPDPPYGDRVPLPAETCSIAVRGEGFVLSASMTVGGPGLIVGAAAAAAHVDRMLFCCT